MNEICNSYCYNLPTYYQKIFFKSIIILCNYNYVIKLNKFLRNTAKTYAI